MTEASVGENASDRSGVELMSENDSVGLYVVEML